MKTITFNDYIVSFDENEITIMHKGVDVTADIIGNNSNINDFILAVANTIVSCDEAIEETNELITETWRHIDKLKAEYKNLTQK